MLMLGTRSVFTVSKKFPLSANLYTRFKAEPRLNVLADASITISLQGGKTWNDCNG